MSLDQGALNGRRKSERLKRKRENREEEHESEDSDLEIVNVNSNVPNGGHRVISSLLESKEESEDRYNNNNNNDNNNNPSARATKKRRLNDDTVQNMRFDNPTESIINHKPYTNNNNNYHDMNNIENSKIPDCANCAICQEIYIIPITLKCGHTYCWKCLLLSICNGYDITSVLNSSNNHNNGMINDNPQNQLHLFTCPQCRTKLYLKLKELNENTTMSNMIHELLFSKLSFDKQDEISQQEKEVKDMKYALELHYEESMPPPPPPSLLNNRQYAYRSGVIEHAESDDDDEDDEEDEDEDEDEDDDENSSEESHVSPVSPLSSSVRFSISYGVRSNLF